jgi:CIC family chloride channel protein
VVAALRDAEFRHGVRWLLYCAVVGIVAGGGALLFDYLSNAGVHFFLEGLAHWSPARAGGDKSPFDFAGGDRNLFILALVPALGGLISGALVVWLAPEASGHGTDAAIDAYHRRGGLIRPRVPLVKILASAVTLGSGGSGGREGPIAQAGAGFGSWIATRLGLSDDDRRILVAAGMGAGIGSIFRAPLAGALFASEILYSSAEFEASVLIPACVASIIAYSTFTLVHGTGTLFRTPLLTFSNPLELIAYFVLALVLVVYGFLYVRVFYGVHGLFERWKFPSALKPAVGGLITGALALGLLYVTRSEESLSVLAFGYGVVQHALDDPATVSIGAGLLALIALGKIATTSSSIGSGGSAGVFGPSMVIGGCAGGAVGIVLHQMFPEVVRQPAAFVVVGMAGFFSGIAKTPISSLVMVSEITGSFSLLIPSLWVCVLTFAMSWRWNLYSKQAYSRVDSPAHQGRFAIEVLSGMRVEEGIDKDQVVQVLGTGDSLRRVLDVVAAADQATFPVIDSSRSLVGLITFDVIRRVMNEDTPTGLVAHDLMLTDFPRLSPNTDMAEALRTLASVDLEEVPVWDADQRSLMGLLSRKRLTRAYVERITALRHAHVSSAARSGADRSA